MKDQHYFEAKKQKKQQNKHSCHVTKIGDCCHHIKHVKINFYYVPSTVGKGGILILEQIT